MKPGELVIHRPTGKRLTVKTAAGNNGMTLCCWIENDAHGNPVECAGAYPWEELRYPQAGDQLRGEYKSPHDDAEPLTTLDAGRFVERITAVIPKESAVADAPQIVEHPKRRK